MRVLNDRPQSLEFKLPARTIDSLVPKESATGRSLLFKMDIEGYEARALRGFTATLDRVAGAVGFIEFNAQYLDWAGESPEAYLGWLDQRFHIFRLASAKHRRLAPVDGFASLPKLHGDPNRVHTDLVLVDRRSPENWLAPEWTIVT